jgi:6-phosphogluconolactonase (cycloisomerase 2 family)
VEPTGRFAYVANQTSNNISGYAINTSNGALTPIPGSPFAAGTGAFEVTVEPTGRFAYVVNSGSNNISGYTISASSGALTPLSGSPFPAGADPRGVITSGTTQ